jgi:hypothetical protein
MITRVHQNRQSTASNIFQKGTLALNVIASARQALEVRYVDDIDIKILEGINAISPKSFVSPVKVNEILKLNQTELGDRLKMLKKSGHVGIITSAFVSSQTLPNFILKVILTEFGRQSLRKKR